MAQILDDSLLGMVQGFLSAETANSFRGMAPRFVAPTKLTLAERLLATTKELNRQMTSNKAAQELWAQAKHFLEMRRIRDIEEREDDADSDDEDRTCMICGRLGGQGNYYNLVRGGVMCNTCHTAEDVPPAVESFF
jgi:hypothetical protein